MNLPSVCVGNVLDDFEAKSCSTFCRRMSTLEHLLAPIWRYARPIVSDVEPTISLSNSHDDIFPAKLDRIPKEVL